MPRLLAAVVLLLIAASPAQARKRDHDTLPDRWERKHHLNLARDDARRDRDHDGLSNDREYRAHTNPRKRDTDRDRVPDGAELKAGLNPRDRDSDDDGIRDGRENAGKIARVSATSITLKLAVGGRLTAQLACDSGAADDAEDTTDPADAAEDADDPAEDAEDGTEPEEAFATQDDPDDPFDEPELSDEEFDRQFDEELAEGGDDCGPALEAGRWVHEATVDRSGSGPVVTAIELVRR
jgi:hypothetical protein